MPLTELWLSKVRRYSASGPNGYDSPTIFSACVALAVKITTQSSGDALKNSSTARRTRSTHSVVTAEVGLVECGLPSTCPRNQSAWRAISDRGGILAAV